MTTITPRELRHRETWQFRAYGLAVEVGWMADPGDGLADAWAIVDGEQFGPFATEDSAILAALALLPRISSGCRPATRPTAPKQ